MIAGMPVIAASPAGTIIENQATGSYVDTADNQTKTVTSDIVKITVGEVAGIIVTATGTSGSFNPGRTAYFTYTITNVGNDPTQFFIPSAANLSGSATQASNIEITGYSLDGTSLNTLGTPFIIPNGGGQTGRNSSGSAGLLQTPNPNGEFQPNGYITVRVPVLIDANANSGDILTVRLGDTSVDPTSNTTPQARLQNQPFTAGSNDVYTVDNPDSLSVTNESTGNPINGDTNNYRQEASAIQSVTVADAGTDFGDAPTSYDTLLADNGARHTISGLYLGAGVTGETDGQPNTTATGDANDDGVTFSSTLGSNYSTLVQAGVSNQITVESSGTGYVNAWIDYNEDGDVLDAGEQILTNQAVVAGTNTLTFTPPNTVLHGPTFARFRLSPNSVLTPSPVGLISGGEVEDYQVYVAAPVPNGAACTTTGLLNGSFEEPNNVSGYSILNEQLVPGWNTNANDNQMELWQNGFNGVPSYSGDQFAELNANNVAALFQDIATVPGSTLTFQFAHRARRNGVSEVVDTMSVKVGTPSATLQQGIYSTDSTDWVVYRGTYIVPAGQYITRFEFNSVSSGSGDNSYGNFIDAVQFSTNTCVTPISPPTLDLDGNNSTVTGNNYQNTFTASGTTVAAADTDVVIADDKTNITRAIIQLTTLPDGASESLTFDLTLATSLGIIVDLPYNSTTGLLTLKGSAVLADYQKVIATLKYSNTNTSPTMSDRIINVKVVDSDKAISNNAVSTIKMSVTGSSSFLLVKRITAINSDLDQNPNDNTPLNIFLDDTSPGDNNTNWPNPTSGTPPISTFLRGAINAGMVQPGDTVEYTIYFLSTGSSAAKNVNFCDRIPDHQTFVPEGYNALSAALNGDPTSDRGIAVSYDGSTLSYTNNDDGDTAKFYPAGSILPAVCGTATNTSGAILVNLGAGATGTNSTPQGGAGGTVPNALSSGSPVSSYGFVRFKAKVN
jgi:uncharacterized repeat protein (TIGR01451 family)